MSEPVFSNYEVRKIGTKLNATGATQIVADCVGSMEDEMETRIVTKNCRGVATKTRVFGTGTGTVTLSLHMPIAMYKAIFALERSDLKKGVLGYGRPNAHPEFQTVADVFDEDGNEKYIAYPKCIMQSGPDMGVENGADEIEEVEVEISVMPDDNGYGKYEALVADLDEDVKTAWLTDFTTELVTKSPETGDSTGDSTGDTTDP